METECSFAVRALDCRKYSVSMFGFEERAVCVGHTRIRDKCVTERDG